MRAEQTPDCWVNPQNLEFTWPNGARALSVQRFVIERGEKLFLQGPSGSGKSTLLGVIAGIFAPSSGDAAVLDQQFHAITAAGRDRTRADAMGVIFQQFNLAPYLTLVESFDAAFLAFRFVNVECSAATTGKARNAHQCRQWNASILRKICPQRCRLLTRFLSNVSLPRCVVSTNCQSAWTTILRREWRSQETLRCDRNLR